jgi:hypothetical protein
MLPTDKEIERCRQAGTIASFHDGCRLTYRRGRKPHELSLPFVWDRDAETQLNGLP